MKTNKEEPLDSIQIARNIKHLKGKLNDMTPLNRQLYSKVNDIPISELTWKDSLASQVISDKSELIQSLSPQYQEKFKKPIKFMVPSHIPSIIQKKCDEFVISFTNDHVNNISQKLIHDGL